MPENELRTINSLQRGENVNYKFEGIQRMQSLEQRNEEAKRQRSSSNEEAKRLSSGSPHNFFQSYNRSNFEKSNSMTSNFDKLAVPGIRKQKSSNPDRLLAE